MEEAMSQIAATNALSRWGSIAVEEARGACLPAAWGSRFRVTLYRWRPAAELADDLPADYTLELYALTEPGGTRRFRPVGDFMELIVKAYPAGLAILTRLRGLTDEARFSYRVMSLFFQQARRLREYLGRTFAGPEDLRLTPSVRLDRHDRDVLPASLGLDARGRGRRWSIQDLLEQGRQLAVGEADPESLVRRGLWEAARRDPLPLARLTPAQIRSVVRQGLFDPGPCTAVRKDAGLKERVQGRLLRALEGHRDDPPDCFERWFFENVDTIVGQVAKQKKDGGPIPREQVRQMLLETVADSWDYLGGCLCLALQAFAQALPDPLSGPEFADFAALYHSQDYLGGVPLALLHARFPFLREAIGALLQQPSDPDTRGALLRLLAYYAEMVMKRREGDREYKRRRLHRNAAGRVGRTYRLDPERDGPSPRGAAAKPAP
jgi:hypothetical protein